MRFLKVLFRGYALCLVFAISTVCPLAMAAEPEYPVENPIDVILSLGGHSPSDSPDCEPWSPDFKGLGSAAAGQFMVDAFSRDFGLSHERANQVFVQSNNGTALAAWAEVAVNRDYYETYSPPEDPGDTWRWLHQVITEYEPSGEHASVTGTRYTANINSITGVGFVGAVDVGLMSASAINTRIVGSRLEQWRNKRRNSGLQFKGVESFGMIPPGGRGMEWLNGFWASPFVTCHWVDERDGYAPYRYKAVGSALGYDHAIDNLSLGGAFVYNRGRLKDKWVVASDNATDNYALTLYGTYYAAGSLFVDASAGYQYGRNRYKRYLASFSDSPGVVDADFVDQKNNTDTWWIGGKIGYDVPLWSALTLTPSLGLLYQSARGSAFTSHSRAPGVNNIFTRMHVGEIGKTALIMPLDLYANYTVLLDSSSSLLIRAGGGIDINLRRQAATGSMRYVGWNREIDIVGGKPGARGWNLGLGAKYQTPRFDVSIDYRYDGGWKKSYNVSGMIGVNF